MSDDKRQAEARDFFSRLDAYSAEYLKRAFSNSVRNWPTKNLYPRWKTGSPIGHILHFTAGANVSGALRHFTEARTASSNWIVAPGLDPRMADVRRDLDLEKDLSAEVLQVVPPWQPSWHGGWVNQLCLGTEVVNCGILRPVRRGQRPFRIENPKRTDLLAPAGAAVKDFDFYTWPTGWSTPFKGRVEAVSTKLGTFFWEAWTRESLATSVALLRRARALYPGIRPEWCLAHHNVKPTKNDVVWPAGLSPGFRTAAFSNDHLDDNKFLATFPSAGALAPDPGTDEDVLRQMLARQADRQEEDVHGFEPSPLAAPIVGAVDTAEEVKTAMELLGYVTAGPALKESVRIYQRSRELVVDGQAGPMTQAALTRELAAWGL